MPTYEYVCPDGHAFDKFQRITEKPRAKCPVCGKAATRKISGGAGLVFKGSGFYITDYGKDGKGPRKAAESEAKPAEGTKGESKGDAEGDAKPAAKSGTPAAKPAPRGEGKKAAGE